MNSSLSALGSYSGIDMATVDQLIEAEKAKGVQFTNRKEKIEREKNAWKDINTRLDSLYNKLETLQKEETFQSRTVSSNVKESPSLSVSVGEDASIGQYRVHVKQLATSARLTSASFDVGSIYDELGYEGEFSFAVYDQDAASGEFHSIEITAKDSLKDISNKINEQTEKSGVVASIIDNRLVLTSSKMGDREIEVQTDLEEFTSGRHFTEGKAAIFTIDGLEIKRDTNVIDDAVEGLTFTLTNVHAGEESDIITVKHDEEKATKAVKDFVEQYNSVIDFISQQLDVGDPTAEDNKTGALSGDGTVMRLQSGLRSMLATAIEGELETIAEIGITIDRYGKASLDEAKFKKVLADDPANVGRFFFEQKVVTETVGEGEEAKETSRFEKKGMSELLRNFINTYISSTSGIISTKNESYDKMIKDINQQIENFDARIDRKRDRYIRQFTALDAAMMQAESQLEYLYSQIGLGQQ